LNPQEKLDYASRLARKYVGRDPRLDAHRDDFVQEAYLGIEIACKKYDPSRGASLETLMHSWARCYMSRYLYRDVIHHAKRIAPPRWEGDDQLTAVPDTADGPDVELGRQQALEHFLGPELDKRLKHFRQSLRPRVRAIVAARLKGATLQEVGTEFGLTRERVRQITERVGL